MPAQKLTPGRLAQIIVMLTILVVAFFWRTFTHEPKQETDIQCQISAGRCMLDISEEQIEVQKTRQNSLKIAKPEMDWTLSSEKNSVMNRVNYWEVLLQPQQSDVILTLTNSNNSNYLVTISLD